MNGWTRSEKIGLYSLGVAVIGLLVGLLTVPEFRAMFGLHQGAAVKPTATQSDLLQSVEPQSSKLPSKPEETKTITVSAQRMWTDTNLQLTIGDLVEINASGRVNASGVSTDAAYKWVGPDGWGYSPEFRNGQTGEQMKWVYVLGPGTSLMCLTGKIGRSGRPFKIGSHYSFTAQESGTLYLGANDIVSDYKGNIVYGLDEMKPIWLDNGGTFAAVVKRVRTR